MKTQIAIITTVLTIGLGGLFFPHTASSATLTLEERVSALEARLQALEGVMSRPVPKIGRVEKGAVKAAPETWLLTTDLPEVGTITSLPEVAPAASLPDAGPPRGGWQNLELWRKTLRTGMTKDDVVSLFGKPTSLVSYGRAGERWWYGPDAGGGTIDFSLKGRLESWLEPKFK